MKTYVLIVSEYFSKTHARAGEPTGFVEKIHKGEKIHTIRKAANLWADRVKEVQRGNACISVRTWSGKPYQSKQVEVKRLFASDGVGLEYLNNELFFSTGLSVPEFDELLSKNDGLSVADFAEWFKDEPLNIMFGIIHFTPFRYLK